jgi:hypothetical protein
MRLLAEAAFVAGLASGPVVVIELAYALLHLAN